MVAAPAEGERQGLQIEPGKAGEEGKREPGEAGALGEQEQGPRSPRAGRGRCARAWAELRSRAADSKNLRQSRGGREITGSGAGTGRSGLR